MKKKKTVKKGTLILNILGHFWAILSHLGSFGVMFGPFWVIFGPSVAFLDKFAES